MKVTIDWLKKYVDFIQSPHELAHQLTMVGLEVDSVITTDFDFEHIVIGQIIRISTHPQKANLTICEVDVGKEKLNLVCGAPNVAVGLKVPIAPISAKLAGNKIMKSASIHGIDSSGMICSEAELGLSHQSDIIMVLNSDATVGTDLKTYLGKRETVLEIDLTTNRPDCLGAIGIAREIAAVNSSVLRKPPIAIQESASRKITDVIEVLIKNPESCPRYTARYVEDVRVGPSPHWLIEKLEAVGLRTINNVVDVTNFVMLETGQPLHAFDYDLLEDQKIIVRHARPGEKFITLDEKEHSLADDALMICDGEKPIALAGIMGGLNSEISNNTTRVLLESAYFTPTNIRKTSKTLGISTDSSQRFERGVDPNGLIFALDRSAQLIAELAGGNLAQGRIDCYPKPIPQRTIDLRIDRVNHLLGTSISAAEIVDILARLEFKTKASGNIVVVEVPSFRVDIEREVDLIEEVSRIYGFDRIGAKTEATIPLIKAENKREKFIQLLREVIMGMGYHEVLNLSLLNQNWAHEFSADPCIRIKNPISEDLDTLRPSLIPGLLNAVKWNKNRLINDQRLFEIGNIFYWDNARHEAHHEKAKIAFIRTGNNHLPNWIERSRQSNFYDLKGDILSLLEKIKLLDYTYSPTALKFLGPDGMDLFYNHAPLGYIGTLSERILNHLDTKGDIFVAELDLEILFHDYSWEKKFQPIPKYPSIKRDLSLILDYQHPVEEVEKLIWQAGGNHLKSVNLFDFYRGKQISEDKKSIAFTLTFFSLDRTLTEKEVDADIEKILENLKSKISAQLRE